MELDVFKSGLLPPDVEKEFHGELLSSLMSYASIMKGPVSFSQTEMLYLSSININLLKLDGDFKLDTFCAIEELKNLATARSIGKLDEKTSLRLLKTIEKRVLENSNSSHSAMIDKLPFGLKYIFNAKFIGLYSVATIATINWFAQTYYNLVFTLVKTMSESKISLAQVLYTDLYKGDRTALFVSLADNPIVTKGLQIYHLQFGWDQRTLFSYMKNIADIVWSSTTLENRRQTMWDLFNADLKIKESLSSIMPTIELESFVPDTAFAVKQTVSNGINWGVQQLGSVLNSYMPSAVTNTAANLMDKAANLMDSASENFEVTRDKLLRSALTAARGGKTPSFDIGRISSVVDELTFQGDYMYNVMSKILLILFIIVLVFLLVYSFSWFDAKATKTKIISTIGKPPQRFRFNDNPTSNLRNTRNILKNFLERM